MEVRNSVSIVTGGGSGIGAALCRALVREGARGVVVLDTDQRAAEAVAGEFGDAGLAVVADVSKRADIQSAVALTMERFGRVDLFASNAGTSAGRGIQTDDDTWRLLWEVNVLAHVYAAQEVLPIMLRQGGGSLLQTLSAGALLTAPQNAPYATTKTAALGLAQWLAVTYRAHGIHVSCLCPQAVRTPMFAASGVNGDRELLLKTLVEPDAVADAALEGLRNKSFLIFSDPDVERFQKHRWGDIDGWTASMAKFQATAGPPPWPLAE